MLKLINEKRKTLLNIHGAEQVAVRKDKIEIVKIPQSKETLNLNVSNNSYYNKKVVVKKIMIVYFILNILLCFIAHALSDNLEIATNEVIHCMLLCVNIIFHIYLFLQIVKKNIIMENITKNIELEAMSVINCFIPGLILSITLSTLMKFVEISEFIDYTNYVEYKMDIVIPIITCVLSLLLNLVMSRLFLRKTNRKIFAIYFMLVVLSVIIPSNSITLLFTPINIV